jgi:hypothetical protein
VTLPQLIDGYRSWPLILRYLSMMIVASHVVIALKLVDRPTQDLELDDVPPVRAAAVLSGHKGPVTDGVFSPDGTRVATASNDGTARLWNAATGKSLTTLRGHGGPVNAVAFSPDSARVLTASDDMTARLWDARSGAAQVALAGHRSRIYAAIFVADGAQVVTLSGKSPEDESPGEDERTLRLWDARSGAELAVLLTMPAREPQSRPRDGAIALSRDGRRLGVAFGGRAHLVDMRERTARELAGDHFAPMIVLSPDGAVVMTQRSRRVVFLEGDPDQRRAEAASGSEPATYVRYDEGMRRSIIIKHGRLMFWDAATGKHLTEMDTGPGDLPSAGFSPDGSRIMAAWNRELWLWPTRGGNVLEPETRIRYEDSIGPHLVEVIFSPDGTRLLTRFDDMASYAELADAGSGEQLVRLKGHRELLTAARFGPDGSRLLTTSKDGTARLWRADRPAASGK